LWTAEASTKSVKKFNELGGVKYCSEQQSVEEKYLFPWKLADVDNIEIIYLNYSTFKKSRRFRLVSY